MSWLWIILCIVAVLILIVAVWGIIIASKENSRKQSSWSPSPVSKSIRNCYSSEDVKYELRASEIRIINSINQNRRDIARTISQTNFRIETAWLNSCEEVYSVSANLQRNLEYQAQNRLQESKFHYYTSLHFRSMLAADMVYHEYEQIDKTYSQMNQLLLNIKNGNVKVSYAVKTQVYQAKDEVKEIRSGFLDRVRQLNNQTATFKNKIRSECGQRGREWAAAREKH